MKIICPTHKSQKNVGKIDGGGIYMLIEVTRGALNLPIKQGHVALQVIHYSPSLFVHQQQGGFSWVTV